MLKHNVEQIVDSIPMKDYHVMIYERIELFYVTFEIFLVFLRVPRDDPSTRILVVVRVASTVSKQTAESLTSQSMRERFIEAASLGKGRKWPRKSSTYVHFILPALLALYKAKLCDFQKLIDNKLRDILSDLHQNHTTRFPPSAVMEVKKTIATLQPVESDARPCCHGVAAEFVVLDFESARC